MSLFSAIISSANGPEYYVTIMSFVDRDLLEPGCSVLLHHRHMSVVGVLTDDSDPSVNVMKNSDAERAGFDEGAGGKMSLWNASDYKDVRRF